MGFGCCPHIEAASRSTEGFRSAWILVSQHLSPDEPKSCDTQVTITHFLDPSLIQPCACEQSSHWHPLHGLPDRLMVHFPRKNDSSNEKMANDHCEFSAAPFTIDFFVPHCSMRTAIHYCTAKRCNPQATQASRQPRDYRYLCRKLLDQ